LLNIGPTKEGVFDEIEKERLVGLSKAIAENKEIIFEEKESKNSESSKKKVVKKRKAVKKKVAKTSKPKKKKQKQVSETIVTEGV